MEDNSSDDEVRDERLSSENNDKKLKVTEGSSQESLNEGGSTSVAVKEENVDSGVSADKSESTSSEDRNPGPTASLSNEVINAAPSGSLHAILLNITRPKRNRNYRTRSAPDQDSDSNLSRDSDDTSENEEVERADESRNSDSDEDLLDDGFQRILECENGSDDSGGSEEIISDTSDDSNTIESDDMPQVDSADTDSDDGPWSPDDKEEESKIPSVLMKTRPAHNYFFVKEIMNREMGVSFPSGKSVKNDSSFEQRFYGSLHAVYRLNRTHCLNKHRGCVNSINFHPEGELLVSGSDDMNVIVWNWCKNVPLQTIKSGHKSNVFQSKFLYLNARSQLNIVTCARDGQVRLLQCPPSGGTTSRRRLASHSRAAHKLHVSGAEPHVVLSAGEDGLVIQSDVRSERTDRLFQVKAKNIITPLYSVHGHPLDTNQLVVAGRDRFVRVYDRRKCNKPLNLYCPSHFNNDVVASKKKLRVSMMHLTCAVYNHDGTEILGSYNDENIYLFDTKNDVYEKDSKKPGFTHQYMGHRNSATFKGVAFFGPKSQYIVSGSDCSYIYIWDKDTESIVQWMQGDSNGVVNCIEAHPKSPVLATSGLDKDVKIWQPNNESDPDFVGLKRVIKENSVRSPLFNEFLPTFFGWSGENGSSDDIRYGGNVEFDGNVCTAF